MKQGQENSGWGGPGDFDNVKICADFVYGMASLSQSVYGQSLLYFNGSVYTFYRAAARTKGEAVVAFYVVGCNKFIREWWACGGNLLLNDNFPPF